MFILGLTGGIGSGKSTVSRIFANHGAQIVDADLIAREIVEPGEPALAELAAAFPGILHDDGTLNRAELARQAFVSAEKTAVLNGITHPRIRERTEQVLAAAKANAGADAVTVYDMPLLIENGETDRVDLVVVVDVPDELRVQRLVEHRGVDEDDARRRIQQQIDRDTRLAAADIVLDNSGTLEDLEGQVDELWADLQRRLQSNPAE